MLRDAEGWRSESPVKWGELQVQGEDPKTKLELIEEDNQTSTSGLHTYMHRHTCVHTKMWKKRKETRRGAMTGTWSGNVPLCLH